MRAIVVSELGGPEVMLTCEPVLRRQLPWLGLRERGLGGGGRPSRPAIAAAALWPGPR
jgi:hypothetical protein